MSFRLRPALGGLAPAAPPHACGFSTDAGWLLAGFTAMGTDLRGVRNSPRKMGALEPAAETCSWTLR